MGLILAPCYKKYKHEIIIYHGKQNDILLQNMSFFNSAYIFLKFKYITFII